MDRSKIGKFIASRRKEKNMTQKDLAEKLGISINAVSKWERGLSFPDVSLYRNLCCELDITIEELINGEFGNSEKDKTDAIIKVVKSKEKQRKKSNIITSIIIILSVLVVISGIFISNNKTKEMEKYYERNYQMSLLARNTSAILKYRNDGNYPDYYGGMYINDNAYNLVVLIVKDKLPLKGTMEYSYFNEIFTIDNKVKIEYVQNSYNDLLEVYNIINNYITNNSILEGFNSVGIDEIKNKVIVSYKIVNEQIIQEFKNNVIDSSLVDFEQTITDYNKCNNYITEPSTPVLNNYEKLLLSINTKSKDFVPVLLSIYDDNTYELFTTYKDCEPGTLCSMPLIYTSSVKGTYNYDIDSLINKLINNKNYIYNKKSNTYYDISLGDIYVEKYDTLNISINANNKYLKQFLNSLNVDLSKCAKPEYE